jgi:hypothetical protein
MNDLPSVMDQQRWNVARARLDAWRLHPPSMWDETAVSDYNDTLTALQAADPGKDFASFRVPPGELAPICTGFTRGTRRHPGQKFMSSKLYCDTNRMLRRVEGVTAYLSAESLAENLAAEEATKTEPPSWFKSQLLKARDMALPTIQWAVKAFAKSEAKKHGVDL